MQGQKKKTSYQGKCTPYIYSQKLTTNAVALLVAPCTRPWWPYWSRHVLSIVTSTSSTAASTSSIVAWPWTSSHDNRHMARPIGPRHVDIVNRRVARPWWPYWSRHVPITIRRRPRDDCRRDGGPIGRATCRLSCDDVHETIDDVDATIDNVNLTIGDGVAMVIT